MMTEEQQRLFENAKTLLDKIRLMLDVLKAPEVVYNEVGDGVSVVDDIALVQCFYGSDVARICATTRAMEFNLRMTRRPSSWVFVECQRKRGECAFGWLRNYGIKYVFVKSGGDSDGIALKSALWNIGAALCSEPNLCFVDSDVVMCASNWVELAKREFKSGKDVVSLSSHQYYEADERCQLLESIGHKYCESGTVRGSHFGFTIGMTREALQMVGGFEPTIVLDDLHMWRKIMGDKVLEPFKEWTLPFQIPLDRTFGYNLQLGWIENIACHIWHGDDHGKYLDLLRLLKICGVYLNSDIICYNFKDLWTLPRWKSSSGKCKVLKATILKYYGMSRLSDGPEGFDIVTEYLDGMSELLGPPSKKHQLFVCSTVKDRFGLNLSMFTQFRDMVEKRFGVVGVKPIVVFFTDVNLDFSSVEVNTVQLEGYDFYDESSQCWRKDVKFPDGSIVYFIPFGLESFNCHIWCPDETTRFSDGTVLVCRSNDHGVRSKMEMGMKK